MVSKENVETELSKTEVAQNFKPQLPERIGSAGILCERNKLCSVKPLRFLMLFFAQHDFAYAYSYACPPYVWEKASWWFWGVSLWPVHEVRILPFNEVMRE